MSIHRFTALALSPIHVGDGTEWLPEAFKLDGHDLIRFDPSAVVASLDDRRREDFLAAIGRAASESELREAQRILRDACTGTLERERIAVSRASVEEIGRALDRPGRRGSVHPFARAGGQAFLPGTALKGAIRTALLSDWVQDNLDAYRNGLGQSGIERGRSGRQSTELQRRVLGETDGDPFRFVRVSDVALPEGCTRIEQIRTWKRKTGLDQQTKGMQMHFECIRPGTQFALEVDVRDAGALLPTADRAMKAAETARASGKAPTRMFAADALFAAVDGFFRKRWQAEADRFFTPPWRPAPKPAGNDGFPILLRVGRFSHFESASVDGLRQGWQPLPKPGKPIAEGSTRAVIEASAVAMPFGWLLLAPVGREDLLDRVAPPPDSGGREPRRQAPSRDRPAVSGLRGSRGMVDGEPVVVERDEGAVLVVRFVESGDIEEVARSEFAMEG